MEWSQQDISEDSGCLTGSTFETSSAIHNSTSNGFSYILTPTTSIHVSRKRKISETLLKPAQAPIFSAQIDTPNLSPFIFGLDVTKQTYLLSSTLNDSLSKSLEKCNIRNYTPNFYVERSPSELDPELKKYRLDDGPEYRPKTRSAPSTPTKQLYEFDACLAKSQSENLKDVRLTPSKGTHRLSKLGSPERAELLYPNLKVVSPQKPKSPQKFKEALKKWCSPAKKRLFEDSQRQVRKIFKKIDRDPMVVFFAKNYYVGILSKIFECLSDVDLYNVSNVSRLWKNALMSDKLGSRRYEVYLEKYRINKENYLDVFCSPAKIFGGSLPDSPVREAFYRCTKLASELLPHQTLQKCPQCMKPAVVQQNIGQCQNPNCEYIYCVNCLSFSTTGPQNFFDKCEKSQLLVDTPKSSLRFGLTDISNAANEELPSFLIDNKFNSSITKCDSSGYLSESDFNTPPVRRNLNRSFHSKEEYRVLKDCNRNSSSLQKKNRRSSLVAVVSSTITSKIQEVMEPSSPPKVTNVACSRQSKKNLKRLKF